MIDCVLVAGGPWLTITTTCSLRPRGRRRRPVVDGRMARGARLQVQARKERLVSSVVLAACCARTDGTRWKWKHA